MIRKTLSLAVAAGIMLLAIGCASVPQTPLVPATSMRPQCKRFYLAGTPDKLAEQFNKSCPELMTPGEGKIPVELEVQKDEMKGGYGAVDLLLDMAYGIGLFFPVKFEKNLQVELVVRNAIGLTQRNRVNSSASSKLWGFYLCRLAGVKGAEELATTRAWQNLAPNITAALNLQADSWIAFAGSGHPVLASAPPATVTAPTPLQPVLLPGNTKGSGVGLALLVGVNDYEMMGKLDNCRQDAIEMRNALVSRGGYSADRVVLLTDGASSTENRPSLANLGRRIEQACKLAHPEDVLLFYFAGHGITEDGKSYLVPQDGGEAKTCIPLDDVQNLMAKSEAMYKVLIVDACHSGKTTRGVSGIVPSVTAESNCVMISSCAANELSYPEGEHGAFTQCLLDGILGEADVDKDQKITSRELFRFVQQRMENWCIKTGKTQRPQMLPQNARDIAVTRTSQSN